MPVTAPLGGSQDEGIDSQRSLDFRSNVSTRYEKPGWFRRVILLCRRTLLQKNHSEFNQLLPCRVLAVDAVATSLFNWSRRKALFDNLS